MQALSTVPVMFSYWVSNRVLCEMQRSASVDFGVNRKSLAKEGLTKACMLSDLKCVMVG